MASTMTTAQASGPGFTALLAAVREVFSAEIYFAAQPNMRFDQFATRKTELTAQAGGQITMPKFGNIKRGGKLTEGTRISTQAMKMGSSSITVDEQGNAIGMSERLVQTAFYDTLAAASMLLGRDMAIVLDGQLRDVVRATLNKVYAGTAISRITVTSAFVFDTDTVTKAVELLEVNNVPKWNNDYYVCFAHPHQLSSLKKSAGWINAQYYVGSTPIFNGEVGRWNDVRFVSTSMMANGSNATVDSDTGEFADPGYDAALDGTGAAGIDIYQAVMFGEYSFGHAVALPVELRDNGVTDFGREHALAWYAIWGSGLLEGNNSVAIETA